MGSRELWFGSNPHGQRVEVVLVHADTWPSFVWRVEWGSPGSRKREVFSGPQMEQDARTYFAAKQAELGTGWELVRRT